MNRPVEWVPGVFWVTFVPHKSQDFHRARMSPQKTESGSFSDFLKLMKQNPHGLVGFGLSVLQVLIHGSWMAFATHLASTGQAEDLGGDDWQMWVISVLMIVGAVLTMISLFLCLYGSIHGKPK